MGGGFPSYRKTVPPAQRIHRRFTGVIPACLVPVTGRSALASSFSFRAVRVVRAMRAGGAKLRGRIETIVLLGGPPGCEYPGVARLFSLIFCAQAHGFKRLLLFADVSPSFFYCKRHSFIALSTSFVDRCMGFERQQ